MPRQTLVSDIIAQIRYRSGQDTSKFISDAEMLLYVDTAAAELYDLLVMSFQDYYIDFANFTTVADQNVYTLPANCYKIRGLDVTEGSLTHSLRPFPFEERARYINAAIVSPIFTNLRYCKMGETIILAPTPTTGLSMTLWYVPTLPRITTTTQTLSMFSGYEAHIIANVCIMIAIKAEEDPLPFVTERKHQENRIVAAAAQRDIGEPASVIDTAGHETFIVPF